MLAEYTLEYDRLCGKATRAKPGEECVICARLRERYLRPLKSFQFRHTVHKDKWYPAGSPLCGICRTDHSVVFNAPNE